MILGRNEVPFPDNPHCKRCLSKNCRELLVQPLFPGKVIFVHRKRFCSIPDYVPSWRNQENAAPAQEMALTDDLEIVSGPVTVTNPRWKHKEENKVEVEVEVEKKDCASFGDTIILTVDVTGMPEGSGITFDIYDTAEDPPMCISSAKGKITNGVGRGEWVVTDKSGNGAESKLAFEGIAKSKASERCEIKINQAEPLIIDIYFEDQNGRKISKVFPDSDVKLIVKTQNLIGKKVDIDLTDTTIDYEYNGKLLENDILKDFEIIEDRMLIPLRTVKGVK